MKKKPGTSNLAVTNSENAGKGATTEREVSVWSRDNESQTGHKHSTLDFITNETPVAVVYNEVSHAVMMASPIDLDDFALGFSLSEGIIDTPDDIYSIHASIHDEGIELAVTLSSRHFDRLKERRRNLTGRTGCGLCGAESLQQARLPAPKVSSAFTITHDAIDVAVRQLGERQPLQAITGGFHSAAWCDESGQILQIREDVGRHNAQDKLIGKLAKDRELTADAPRFLLMSSRASYEIIQKAAMAGIAIVAAVSAPTSLAIDIAEEVGITLLGFARDRRHVCYANSQRVTEA